MRLINRITENAIQKIFLTGNGGERIEMTLRYMASQEAWIADFKQGSFVANGIRVTNAINFMRQFRNKIDFGISCDTLSGLDPYYPDDFIAGRAQLYLLSAADVLAIEEAFYK